MCTVKKTHSIKLRDKKVIVMIRHHLKAIHDSSHIVCRRHLNKSDCTQTCVFWGDYSISSQNKIIHTSSCIFSYRRLHKSKCTQTFVLLRLSDISPKLYIKVPIVLPPAPTPIQMYTHFHLFCGAPIFSAAGAYTNPNVHSNMLCLCLFDV